MNDKAPSASVGERIWSFFASVKLSFALLLALAATSIAGTLLPQKEPAEVYIREFGQNWGGLILGLGLDDMYHAPWFLLLLSALAANLVICSLNRLPGVLKIVRKDPAADLDKKRAPAHSFTLAGPPEKAADRARAVLQKALGKVHQGAGKGGGLTLLAQRGAWSRLGVYVVHLSVLIIFAGAMVGNLWGFSGYININQGQTLDHVVLDRGQFHHLGFALRLDKFKISYYDNGMPSEYRSDVTFLQGGKPVKKASLVVNDPAEFQGIVFYQSSYGQRPGLVRVRITRGEKSFEADLEPGRWNKLPGGGQAGVLEVREKVTMGRMYSGPVARLAYQPEGGEPIALTAFQAGNRMPQKGPVKIEIIKLETVPYSGLQVKYDPGVWFIWVGCTLMVIGFLITFYLSHQKVWIRLSPAGSGRTRVEIAGSANKNRPGLQRLLQRLARSLREGEQ